MSPHGSRNICNSIGILGLFNKAFARVKMAFSDPIPTDLSAHTSSNDEVVDEVVEGEELVKHDHWKYRHPNRETSPLILAYDPKISSSQITSPFFTLPIELRILIYGYVFDNTLIHLGLARGGVKAEPKGQGNLLGLPLACIQLYNETIRRIYTHGHFYMTTLPTLPLFRLSIPIIHLASIRKITVDVSWDDLVEWFTDSTILEVSLTLEIDFIMCFSRLRELVLVVRDHDMWEMPEGIMAEVMSNMFACKSLRVRKLVVKRGWREAWEGVRKDKNIGKRFIEIVEEDDELA